MTDMSDGQRKAIRAALGKFVGVKIELQRGEQSVQVVPYLAADPSKKGAAVTVIYGDSQHSALERGLGASIQAMLAEAKA